MTGRPRKEYSHLVGKKFGKLTILKLSNEKCKSGAYQVECLCECGNTILRIPSEFKRNTSMASCGCMRQDITRVMGKANKGKGLEDPTENAFNELYGQYVGNAKYSHRDWKIDKMLFRQLTKGNCEYCGDPPLQIKQRRNMREPYIYNGIDRVDNNKGYLPENCVSCCKTCNDFKRSRTVEEFISHSNKITSYQTKKNSL